MGKVEGTLYIKALNSERDFMSREICTKSYGSTGRDHMIDSVWGAKEGIKEEKTCNS